MRQGGRPSAAHLEVVSRPRAVMPGDRPEPPASLRDRPAAEWREIVARMPPKWFERESWPLLEALCVATIEMKDYDQEISRYKGVPKNEKAFRRYKALFGMRALSGDGCAVLDQASAVAPIAV